MKRSLVPNRGKAALISTALVTVSLAAAAIAPATAADHILSYDQTKTLCKNARIINGKQNPEYNTDYSSLDWCNFTEISFQTYDGPTERVTPYYRNCPPRTVAGGKVAAKWSMTVSQYDGVYQYTQQGGGIGLLGALNGQWLRHEGTLDLTINSKTVEDSQTFDLPAGKQMYITFTPKMQVMKGRWEGFRKWSGGYPGGSGPDDRGFMDEEVRGPNVLPGGALNGVVAPAYSNCCRRRRRQSLQKPSRSQFIQKPGDWTCLTSHALRPQVHGLTTMVVRATDR